MTITTPTGGGTTGGTTGGGTSAFYVGTSAATYAVSPPMGTTYYATVNAAIAAASAGATIYIGSGNRNENITVDKRLTIIGAGRSSTTITSAAGTTPVITVTGGGASATSRLSISGLKVTGATGGENAGAGILVQPSANAGYYTFENIDATANQGAGIAFNGANTIADVQIYSSNASSNGNAGIRVASAITSFDGLDISSCTIRSNASSGFSTNPSAANVVNTNFNFTNCDVSGNNTVNTSNQHQMSFFGFNGKASLTNVTVSANAAATTGATGKGAYGIVFTKSGTSYVPSDNITLTNVTVSGSVGKTALSFQKYSDVSKISLSNVDVKGCTCGTGWQDIALDVTGTFNLGDTKLKTLALWSTGGATATSASFYTAAGALLNKETEADRITIESQVVHRLTDINGLSALGLARWSSNAMVVRKLAAAITGTTGVSSANLLQLAIDAAAAGDTIYVVGVAGGTNTTNTPAAVTIAKAVRVGTAGISIVGSKNAASSDSPYVTIGGESGHSLHIDNVSNVTVRNLSVNPPVVSGGDQLFYAHITGTSGTASGIVMDNVRFSSGTVPGTNKRGVSVNTAGVTFTACQFPATQNYSLGIGSSRGVVCSGCTFQASGYGTIGIFPSAQATDKTTQSINLRTGNTFANALSNVTGKGNSDSAIIQIQPGTGPAITYGRADSGFTVLLPDAFLYAYIQKVQLNGAVITGSESVSVCNDRSLFGDEALVYNGWTNNSIPFISVRTAYLAPFAALSGTQKYIVYGKNLETNAFYTETFFTDAAEAVADAVSTYAVDGLSNSSGSAAVTTTIETVINTVSSAAGSDEASISSGVAAVISGAQGKNVDTAVLAASVVVAALQKGENNEPIAKNATIGALQSSSLAGTITAVSTSDRDGILDARAPANVSVRARNNDMQLAISNSSNLINLPTMPAARTVYYFPMKTDTEYTVQRTARSGSVVLKYNGTILAIKELDNSFTNLPINATIVVAGQAYMIDVLGGGGVGPAPTITSVTNLHSSTYVTFTDETTGVTGWHIYDTTGASPVLMRTVAAAGTHYVGSYATAGTYKFKVAAYDAGGEVSLSNEGTLTLATDIPCFPAGQRVLAPTGWRAVETLRSGDLLVTDTGLTVPIVMYSGKVVTTAATAPVTIPAGLFGRAGPTAPVRLSPSHAISLGKGRWDMPAHLLEKHAGVVTQDAPGAVVDYYHITMPNFLRDNVVLEGGLVAESYGGPYVLANKLVGVKMYTYSKKMDCYTRTTEASLRASGKKLL